MNTSNTELDLSGLLNKLTAENLEAENQIKLHQKQIKEVEKRIKDNDDVIRALRSRLGVGNSANKSTTYGNKAETLRAAIRQITKERFTQFDILAEIERSNPGAQIDREWLRTALWTCNDKKELIYRVRKGNNRQPAEYEKLSVSGSAIGHSTANGHLTILRDEKNPRVSDSTTQPKSFLMAARQAIQQFQDRFGTKDIFDYCNRKWPGFAKKNTDFSNALWSLCKNGEIMKVEGSVGHNRAVYQKTKNFSAVTTA